MLEMPKALKIKITPLIPKEPIKFSYTILKVRRLILIPSTILEKVRFPLANITKKEVFELAEKANLAAAKRKESQDFVGEEFFDMIFSSIDKGFRFIYSFR